MKVLIVGGGLMYSRMFESNGWTVTESLHDADLIQFTGGSDVMPSLYGEARHPLTSSSPSRDKVEVALFEEALSLRKPMTGICRGSQFLNVMCGGSLYQHVDNHAVRDGHMMVDVRTGSMLSVTSTHHQMMRPSELGQVIAVASESSLYEHMDGDIINRVVPAGRGEDVEVVYYERENVLCFQGHPEFLESDAPAQTFYFDLLETTVCAD